VIDADALARQTARHRAARGLSLRAAAEESGVPFNTLSRMEKGHLPDVANFARLVTWLGSDPAEFFRGARPVRTMGTVDAVRDVLHGDPLLPAAAAEQIAGLVEQLYSTLVVTAGQGLVHLHVAPTLVPAAAARLGEVLGQMERRAAMLGDVEPGWAP
jgi:transcriptional regulator with XRE-family HTH domain